MDARRVNPSVVEIKQRAHVDGVIDRFIAPARALRRVHVFLLDLIRRAIHFFDELEQGFIFVRKPRSAEVFQDGEDELAIFEKLRSTCGVRAYSEGAVVSARSEGGYQFAHPCREGRRPAHHALSEIGEMLCDIGLEREQVPDLRKSRSTAPAGIDQLRITAVPVGLILYLG